MISRMTRFVLLSAVLAAGISVPAGLAAQAVEDTSLSNRFLRLKMSTEGHKVHTTSFENLRTGDELAVQGDDFQLVFQDGSVVASSDLAVKDVRRESGPNRERLAITLEGKGLSIRMVTELGTDQWWATRWLDIRAAAGGGARRLAKISLGRWKDDQARGPSGPGKTVPTLGCPSGCGQAIYAGDVFLALAHPGAENFVANGVVSCDIPAYQEITQQTPVRTPRLVAGAGARGAARRAFLGYIDATRAVPSHMVFLVNDWYWKDKSKPFAALEALVRLKKSTGVPIDSFTLDDGWDFDWDEKTGLWGRLNRTRFPGGWDAFCAVGRKAGIGVSLWFGPIGGYGYRPRRIAYGRELGFETNGDKFCLSAPRYRRHVIESFSRWARRGMDYIKVDGFWPNCRVKGHGHPTGASAAIAHMDSLIGVFSAWHKARPDLVIGYTSGSNPSPFWLQHADFVWRGGADDSHAGAGEPFDRHNTFIDRCLEAHRETDMPVSAFVVFDIVQGRVAGSDDDVFERGAWWLAARTSLLHDWYVQASDLSLPQWRSLARAARWSRRHEKVFRWSRMVGGNPAKGEIYGFSAFDDGRGTLALRNPAAEPRVLETSLEKLLDLPAALEGCGLRLQGVYGDTKAVAEACLASKSLRIELPPLAIAVWEVEADRSGGRALRGVMVPMRDGTKLAADVYLPRGDGPFPAVVARSVYGRGNALFALPFTSQGMAFVPQDTRGRGDSEGIDRVFADDGWRLMQDGLDTVDWVRGQQWCNGKVGTWGGSALGITQILLGGAGARLDFQSIGVAAARFYGDLAYQGGVWRHALCEPWLRNQGRENVIGLWKSHPYLDTFWKTMDSGPRAGQVRAPALHVGGWWDIFQQGTIDNFVSRQDRGGAGARGRQMLVVGPWAHGTHRGPRKLGDLSLPENYRFDVDGLERRLYRHYLLGEPNGADSEPPVRYYTLGDADDAAAPGNEWRTAERWPPFETEATPLYLASGGKLAGAPPAAAAGAATFTFDPRNPCPTAGGANLALPSGPFDQRKVSSRPDVLRFATEPLDAPLEATGRVKARLFVSSDAPDTDFTAKLVDVYPDGREILLVDGIRRVKLRGSLETPDLLPPGEVGELEIDLWSISIIFARGHRIGLHVSSSNYPRFEKNPNTGADFPSEGNLRTARNTVHFGSRTPSALILPVRPVRRK